MKWIKFRTLEYLVHMICINEYLYWLCLLRQKNIYFYLFLLGRTNMFAF